MEYLMYKNPGSSFADNKHSELLHMRLGILIYSLTGGGAERFTSYLITFLPERKISVQYGKFLRYQGEYCSKCVANF